MADNLDTPFGKIASRDEAGVHYQRVLFRAELLGGAGAQVALLATVANGLIVDVSRIQGVVAVSGPVTDAQLRATPLTIIRQKTPLTGSIPAQVAVGIASAPAVAANANRKGLLLTNTSPNWIYIAFAATAVVGAGIPIAPNGGTFSMSEFDFSTQEIRAIASAAGSNLAIQEFV